MKKLILLALTAVMMAGCDNRGTDHYANGFRISIIDSCEYVKFSSGFGAHFAHKGNCKYCEQRRKQELKELVKELKGEEE